MIKRTLLVGCTGLVLAIVALLILNALFDFGTWSTVVASLLGAAFPLLMMVLFRNFITKETNNVS